MAKATEYRKMTDSELAEAYEAIKEELFNLRFQWNVGQLEDYTRIRQLKRDTARLLTVQRERELAADLVQEDADA